MDNETSGLADGCLIEHTADSTLCLLSNRESSSNQPTGRLTENAEPAANTVTDTALPKSTSEGSTLSGNFHTNLMEAADNSQPNLEPSAPDYNTTRQIQSQPGRANGSGSARMDPTPENPEVPLPQASLPCMSNYIVESLEPRNSSRLAIEQGVARAKALLQRAREEKAGREQ